MESTVDVPDYTIEILGFEDRNEKGDRVIGYSVTLGLHKYCLAGQTLAKKFPALNAVVFAADSSIKYYALNELVSFIMDCRVQVYRELIARDNDVDWLQQVRGWVAEWDTVFFEQHRRR